MNDINRIILVVEGKVNAMGTGFLFCVCFRGYGL